MNDKIVSLSAAKAKAAGVDLELATVIGQLNERFGIRIELVDERLERFKGLFPALNEAAKQNHQYKLEETEADANFAFQQGIEVGRAQMMTDIIICILESDGLLKRN